MAVTIHDLARLSGYNASTISRALRGDKRVKESTRRRIIELAERHGYTPNLPARQLARGKTGNIWCCFGFAEAERERNLAVRLDELLYHRGYDLQIVLHNNSPERFRQWLRKLHQKVADAAVLIPPGNTEEFRELVPLINALPVPHLSLDRFWPELTCPVITTDNFSAARHLVDRCLEWGAREFYLEFGDVNPVLRARERAIRERLRELNLPCRQLCDLADLAPVGEPVGILTNTTPVLPPLPPERIVYGGFFDNWSGPGRERFRRIILCRQNFDRIAERAMELLLSMLESPQNPVPAMEEVPAESFPEF